MKVKKTCTRTLALVLCLCMVLGLGVSASAANGGAPAAPKYASDWEYKVDAESGTCYWMLDAVYCENPVDPAVQHLVIYAPEAYMTQTADGSVVVNPNGKVISSTGVVYTAENAPMLFHNTSGGYTSSKIQDVDVTYLQEGYVHVSIQTRGKEITDDAGKFIGQFPAIMVDLKAGVRFLKANDDELPGNSERIVSRGFSSGGAVSAMLGASGNSPLFDSYLKEIGAADAGDDIFIALASAPITNLSSADASYEWFQHANTEYFLFNAMAFDREGNNISDIFPVGRDHIYPLGSNILGGAHEDELSDVLYQEFVEYVRSMGFDLGEDGRSGSFYEGFVQIYSDSLTEFVARYDELREIQSTPRAPLPDTAEEYLASIQSENGWFTYDKATGKVTITSLDAMAENYLVRNKMCPSLDSYNYKSNENDAFKDADGHTVHFSGTVRDALKTLIDNKDQYQWTEDDLAYITVLFEDYDAGINEESSKMLENMSPINYVIGKEGYDADIAPYWRLRVGSADGDHGAPAAWLIAQGLEKYQPDVHVSVGIAWGMGHTLSELTEQDMYNYIADIMVKEDGLQSVDTAQFANDWEYKVDEKSGVAYWALDAVYCENPTEDIQHLAVYAPVSYMTKNADGTVTVNPNGKVVSSTGAVYTAENAPILYHNTSSGYAASKIETEFLADYIPEGYVYVSIATRGSESQNAAGEYIGQFPAVVVDLKAGVRFLKEFDVLLPGSSERIISRGVSSGGAVSAMLGASGNSPIFDSYLDEIGAYDTSDDIFIAIAAAPITNLDSADASYEWFQKANDEYYLFDRMAVDREGNKLENFPVGKNNYHALGDNVLGGAHEDEMSEVLYDWFVDYVRDLGFDLGEDGRSGSFYEDFLQLYSDSLTEFIARYDELKGPMSDPRNQFPDTVEEYLDKIQTDENWFTYDAATGKATITSLDAMVSNFLDRNKMSPSLDSYNYMSNEGAAFVTADGTRVHFSATVRDALKTLIDNKNTYKWSDDDLAYIETLYEDYNADISDASTEMLEIMSPINYIVGKEGYDGDIAPYWRLRVGSADGDHGAPAAWLIAQGLEKYDDVDISMGIAWSMGHTLAELTNQDLFDYISGVMVKEDGLEVLDLDQFSGDWEYKVDEESGVAYWTLDTVYCTNPVDPSVQHLVIYAPEAYMTRDANGSVVKDASQTLYSSNGVKYNADTAPILYLNSSGGYSSSSIKDVETKFLKQGYVQVSIGTRGKETMNDDGEFIGQFPVIVADLKAGVRFLKAFDNVLPGSSERIISHGASSGGALSAMLGSTGNAAVFEPYLKEIGAYDTSDDIFIALCYCPITNLDTADAAFEWYQYGNDEYFLFNAMAFDREGNPIENFPVGMQNFHALGDNVLGGAHEDELAEVLRDWYVDYIRGLGFDLSEDGFGGEYYDGLTQVYADGLTEFLARYDELKDALSSPRAPLPDTKEEYIDSLKSEADWFDYDPETGIVTIDSLTDVMAYHVPRGKMAPSLDSYNRKSNEGSAFVTADGEYLHFSFIVRDALQTLIDNKDEYGWTDEELAYITALHEDYAKDVTAESTAMLEIMSPINYVLGEYGSVDLAPYFRWHVGSADGDHGMPAAWLTHNALLRDHSDEVDSEISIIWTCGHGDAEYDYQDLYDYIDAIMVEEDNLGQIEVPFEDLTVDDWYWNDAMHAFDTGLMVGNNAAGTLFDGDVTVDRAMVVTVLYRLEGSPEVEAAASFDDVAEGDWFANPVAWAQAVGIAEGYEGNSFAPEQAVSCQELISFLYRYADMKGYNVSAAASLAHFTDADSADDYAADAVAWANDSAASLTLSLQDAAQRSQFAAVLHQFIGE